MMDVSEPMPRSISGLTLYAMRFFAQDEAWRPLARWTRWMASQEEAEADARRLAEREWPSLRVATIVGVALHH